MNDGQPCMMGLCIMGWWAPCLFFWGFWGVCLPCLATFPVEMSHNRNAISDISSAVQQTVKHSKGQSASKPAVVAEKDKQWALSWLGGHSYWVSLLGLLQNELKAIHRSGIFKEDSSWGWVISHLSCSKCLSQCFYHPASFNQLPAVSKQHARRW